MSDVTNSIGSPTMTRSENKPSIAAVKELMGANHDALREIVQDLLQEMLEGEMTEVLGASKSERSEGRIGYRSGLSGISCVGGHNG
jgi:putative transposase